MEQKKIERARELRASGMMYKDIAKELGETESAVYYNCGPLQKEKAKDRDIRRNLTHPMRRKTLSFLSNKTLKPRKPPTLRKILYPKYKNFGLVSLKQGRRKFYMPNFTYEQVLEKIGDSPVCYLTRQTYRSNETTNI